MGEFRKMFGNKKQIEQFAEEITNPEFIALYGSGLIDEETADFEMAIYRNIVDKIIKDSKK